MLQNALPAMHAPAVASASSAPALHVAPVHKQATLANWASDFMSQTVQRSSPQAAREMSSPAPQVESSANLAQRMSPAPAFGMQWSPPPMGMHMPSRVMSPLSQAQFPASAALWDKEFQSHETSVIAQPVPQVAEASASALTEAPQMLHDADDLARTAGELIETVKNEQNPKFKNSQFMQLMRGLRDGEIVVDGNDMVKRAEASEAVTKDKGKGRMQGD